MATQPKYEHSVLDYDLADLPQPSTDVEQNREHLDRFGYAIHKDLLSAEETARLRDRLVEQAELECEQGVATYRAVDPDQISKRMLGKPDDIPAWQALHALINKGREFIDLAMHPVVKQYGQYLFAGTPHYLAQSVGLVVRNGSHGQAMHCDQIGVPFQTPMPVYFHAMVALSDFEADMGATRFVPGSHRWPSPQLRRNPETGQLEAEQQHESVPVVCKAGSAIIFESRVWHHQGISTSGDTRLSILNGYCQHFMKPQENYAASLQDDVYATLTKEEREMFGFKVEMQYGGHLFARFPGDRRLNTNVRYPYIPELRKDGSNRAEPFDDMRGHHS